MIWHWWIGPLAFLILSMVFFNKVSKDFHDIESMALGWICVIVSASISVGNFL